MQISYFKISNGGIDIVRRTVADIAIYPDIAICPDIAHFQAPLIPRPLLVM
jgi:hypothetical protein